MDKDLASQVQMMFTPLNRQSAAGSFPAPGALSDLLSKYVDPSAATKTVVATPRMLSCFATAAVEMWLRAVHSFLISVSLTKASPIWASVAGYYSSHYSIRAWAHLFGAFQLHKKRQIVRLDRAGRHFIFEKKHGNDREHKFYWKLVSEHPQLVNDPFFYPNQEDKLDGGHRNKANYWDHICRYPVFQPLETQVLKERIERISTIHFSSVPVPRVDADYFPDIDNIQIIAYHRIVKFRNLVDEVCANNRFWKIQRTPSWCPLRFSVVESVFVALYQTMP